VHPIETVTPARAARAVTPNDAADLALGACRFLTCNTAGNIVVILADDTVAVTYVWFPGAPMPVRAKRVLATGTTAAGIVAHY
jgi:hypothetical protein